MISLYAKGYEIWMGVSSLIFLLISTMAWNYLPLHTVYQLSKNTNYVQLKFETRQNNYGIIQPSETRTEAENCCNVSTRFAKSHELLFVTLINGILSSVMVVTCYIFTFWMENDGNILINNDTQNIIKMFDYSFNLCLLILIISKLVGLLLLYVMFNQKTFQWHQITYSQFTTALWSLVLFVLVLMIQFEWILPWLMITLLFNFGMLSEITIVNNLSIVIDKSPIGYENVTCLIFTSFMSFCNMFGLILTPMIVSTVNYRGICEIGSTIVAFTFITLSFFANQFKIKIQQKQKITQNNIKNDDEIQLLKQ